MNEQDHLRILIACHANSDKWSHTRDRIKCAAKDVQIGDLVLCDKHSFIVAAIAKRAPDTHVYLYDADLNGTGYAPDTQITVLRLLSL